MKDLQSVFNKIKEIKEEQKVLKEAYHDALNNSSSYQKVIDELKVLKEKKKSIENGFQQDLYSNFTKLDRLKLDLESEREMLSDIAITQLMNGRTVEVVDKYENKYEPKFSVTFKKV
jgi:predicted nuclease with TOPRIM domain